MKRVCPMLTSAHSLVAATNYAAAVNSLGIESAAKRGQLDVSI